MKLQSGDGYVQINVIGRSHPNSDDYWDGNWLDSEVKINASGIKGISGISLRSDDFLKFYEELLKLQGGQVQEVEFTTMEEGIYLKGKLDITGNVKWEGSVKLEPEGNSLSLRIETDNASIKKLSAEVKEILEKYPVIGNFS